LSGFNINSDGSLGAAVTGSPYATGNSPYGLTIGVAVAPNAEFVVVTNNGLSAAGNNGSDTVTLFSLNTATGALTATGSLQTGQTPQFTNLSIGLVAPTIAPAAVYASNVASGNISAYTVASGTGVLAAAAAPTVVGVPGNGLSAADLLGNSFYTAGTTAPEKLAAFSVNQSTAALTPLTTSPYTFAPAAVPSTVLADPSERFVYVAGKGVAGSIFGYDTTTAPGDLTKLAGSPFTDATFANLNALAMDPQGQFVFALRTGFVEPVAISAIDGHLVPPPVGKVTTAAGTWTDGVVDSSGQYLLALDSTAKHIQSFSITPSSGTTPLTDGLLILVNAAVSVGGTAPSSIAIDPLDRFVFVTDSGANTSITVFSFDVTTGKVAKIGSSAVIASGAGQAAVDATGTYLYAALAGTPGSVAAFKIGAGGTLTAVAGSPFPATGNGTLGVAISNSIK
jgi:6-phosphogluconolactonase